MTSIFAIETINGTHLRVGNRTSGLRGRNQESHSLGIEVSKPKNRLQSEIINSRRGEPIIGGKPINNTHSTHATLLPSPKSGLRTVEGTAPPRIASRSYYAVTESNVQ